MNGHTKPFWTTPHSSSSPSSALGEDVLIKADSPAVQMLTYQHRALLDAAVPPRSHARPRYRASDQQYLQAVGSRSARLARSDAHECAPYCDRPKTSGTR